MRLKRVRLSNETTNRLRMMKARTGLTANLVCRIAFCYSIEDARVPGTEQYDTEGLEINRYTLTGEFDDIFVGLLRERLSVDGLDYDDHASDQFLAHINRGVEQIAGQVKGLEDFEPILAKSRAEVE